MELEKIKSDMASLNFRGIDGHIKKAINEGSSAIAIKNALVDGFKELRTAYLKREIALPELLVGGDMLYQGFSTLNKYLKPEELTPKGKVIIGTIGSSHDVAKNLVKLMLNADGFEVHDLGANLSPKNFVEAALKIKPNIVASSCMFMPALQLQKAIEQELRKAGIRDQVKTLIGGAVATPKWASEIGADGYGKDMFEGVTVANRLVNELKQGG